MKTGFRYLAILAGLFFISCTAVEITSVDGYINVPVKKPVPGGPKHVRLEVVGDRIIHVSATPDASFNNRESLVVLPQNEYVEYDAMKRGDTVIVQTSAIKA